MIALIRGSYYSCRHFGVWDLLRGDDRTEAENAWAHALASGRVPRRRVRGAPAGAEVFDDLWPPRSLAERIDDTEDV